MLVDDSPDDSDLRVCLIYFRKYKNLTLKLIIHFFNLFTGNNNFKCVANIIIASGEALNQLNSMECDYTMLKCRKWLTSNSIQLEETTKFLLLNVIFLLKY